MQKKKNRVHDGHANVCDSYYEKEKRRNSIKIIQDFENEVFVELPKLKFVGCPTVTACEKL